MRSKQQKEWDLAQRVLHWDTACINQDESRTWLLLGEEVAGVQELYYDPQSTLFYFFGHQILNEHLVAFQRWFDDQEQEIFDPTCGFIVPLSEPETLLYSFIQEAQLPIDPASPVLELEWKLSPYSIGKQWLQRLENGLHFALRLDECNLVHTEILQYPSPTLSEVKEEDS